MPTESQRVQQLLDMGLTLVGEWYVGSGETVDIRVPKYFITYEGEYAWNLLMDQVKKIIAIRRPPEPITQEEIINLMLTRALTFEKMIDAMLDVNKDNLPPARIMGLAQFFYYYTLHNKELRKPGITHEDIEAFIKKAVLSDNRKN